MLNLCSNQPNMTGQPKLLTQSSVKLDLEDWLSVTLLIQVAVNIMSEFDWQVLQLADFACFKD